MNPLKTWFFHNLIAHPLCEIVYWLVRPFGKDRAEDAAGRIHDATLPPVRWPGDGRG